MSAGAQKRPRSENIKPMSYPQQTVKADNPAENKFFYWCQTPGCGAVINPEFPIAEKNPSPKWCKDCQIKATRELIEAEHRALVSKE
jgi:hypothetical protein